MSVDHLFRAKREKNDEFYTRYEDVERELAHYPGAFRGKTVYCNCDDPHWSSFPKYFLRNFRKLGLRRLISTCYNGEPGEGDTPDMFAKPTGLTAWKLDVSDCDGEDIDSFVNSHVEILKGNGAFQSRECVALLKECDIVCTNPPFSIFTMFFNLLMQEKKDFLVIGNMISILKKDIFPFIKDARVLTEGWRGFEFKTPEGTMEKLGNCCWYTTLKSDRAHEPRTLTKKYSSEEFPRYDNYDAIEVSKSENIPYDYNGVMGVPISFMERYCPEQFELVGATLAAGGGPRLKGEELFARLLIRKRSKNASPCEMLLTRTREQCDDGPTLFALPD